MRRNILIIALLLLGISLMGQTLKQEVIATAGGYNVSSDNQLSISWTLGETIIPTFKSGDGTLILTHGFQQKLIITGIDENIDTPVKVKIFPNPASEQVKIQFDAATDKEVLLYLIDAQGKLVKTDRIDESSVEKTLNLEDLPAGLYYLRMIKGNLVNIYKVVKL
ncbi:MAG TPA: T9SS type A sorting domain-containing protein [Bacteroidales bacterium]|nr:T9SS type A sorting domain-containing protein [Bacteroidales bacterium]